MKHPNAEIIKAWLDGEEVEYAYCVFDGGVAHFLQWQKVMRLSDFDETTDFRIKPKVQTYRIALIRRMSGIGEKQYMPYVCIDRTHEDQVFNGSNFVRWLTDRIEYEV